MKVGLRIVALSVAVAGLAACSGGDQEELQRWTVEQRSHVKPSVQPIAEPKKFTPEAYTEAGQMEPFNMQRLTQALRKDSAQSVNSALIAPELSRRKEPLEAFPLDSMAMVGSLDRAAHPVALVKVDNLLYQVKLGNHLGQNYGLVTRITETELDLREIVQDAAGEWIERPASLQLQERSPERSK